jgi:hypothetical protein
MDQQTVTLIVAGLGIGGTLGGIVVGHVLTRSWQEEQWLLNNRKEEFRELMTALARSFSTIERIKLGGIPSSVVDPEKPTKPL